MRVSLWRAILDADGPLLDEWQDAPPLDDAGRLGGLLTPALAAHFLRPVEARLGTALLDAAAVRQSLLFNRFNGGVQRRWMHEMRATGIPVAYLKGFGSRIPLSGSRPSDIGIWTVVRKRLGGVESAGGFSSRLRAPGVIRAVYGVPQVWIGHYRCPYADGSSTVGTGGTTKHLDGDVRAAFGPSAG